MSNFSRINMWRAQCRPTFALAENKRNKKPPDSYAFKIFNFIVEDEFLFGLILHENIRPCVREYFVI